MARHQVASRRGRRPGPAGDDVAAAGRDDALGTAADDAPASARFQLFDEVTSLLLAESRIQPVAVFLDDLHAADEPSLLLLLLDFLVPAGGRFAEAERLIGQAAALGEECGEPGARDVSQDQDWDLRAGQGRIGELAGTPPEMFPDPESAQARWFRAAALLAAGDRIQAAALASWRLPETRRRVHEDWHPGLDRRSHGNLASLGSRDTIRCRQARACMTWS